MAEKLTTKNCIITCQNRLVYNSPAHIPSISSCNIPCSINVRVNGMSTISTFKESRVPNSIPTMASITFFGGISRINIDNSNSFFKSLIFNKVLKLSKSPLVNPFVIFSSVPNSSQVLHNNNISTFQRGNNRFAYYLNLSEGLNSAIPPTNKLVGILASNTIL